MSAGMRQVQGQAKKFIQQDKVRIHNVQGEAQACSQHNPGKDYRCGAELKRRSHGKK